MKQTTKILLVLVNSIFIFLICCLLLLNNYFLEPSNNVPNVIFQMRRFLLDNLLVTQVIFVLSAFALVFLLITLLVIILYPNTSKTFVLKNDQGQLTIHNNAIQGLVSSSIDQRDFIEQPKINVKEKRNKINVTIDGKLKRTSSLIGQTKLWQQQLEQELKQVLGNSEKISISVNYKNHASDHPARDKARVE